MAGAVRGEGGRAAARARSNLIWLGDSITQDWELEGPPEWRNFAPVWEEFYGDRHAVNLGFKGDNTAHLLWRMENGELEGIQPKAAVVLIGANNMGRVHWNAEQTVAGIEAVVALLQRRLPATRILLIGVLPSVRSKYVTRTTNQINRALAERFPPGSPVVFTDLGALFMRDGQVDRTQFLDDQLTPPDPPLHPTAQAQRRMAEAIEPTLAAMLGDRAARAALIRVVRDLAGLRAAVAEVRPPGRRLALVPTMGALHDGHLSLLLAARERADAVSASIFVNPLQFGPAEDFSRYPRDEAGDLRALEAGGCDLVWLPPVDVMYPAGDATLIDVGGPAEGWEGAARPGHFRGVATVCTKLFAQTGADVAMFGEKDWQQVQVVRRVVADLCLPIRIDACPTVREADGLAMSSRNRFLRPEERALAPRLFAALRGAGAAIEEGGTPEAATKAASEALGAAGFVVDYLALVEPETMRLTGSRPARLIAAAKLGSVRLLDNIAVG